MYAQARLNEIASQFVLLSYIMLPEISSAVTSADVRSRHNGRGWSGVVNDHPGWESPINVASSQKIPVLKELEEKRRLGFKDLRKYSFAGQVYS
ncbi:hypothetical protein AVEN_190632-1 [Araneus ventricosus]|uniref:Uncharacterized protein n=1 Tax=Araneus ventricosus TaxID=182803 RepID=A0A4Y2I2E4_ARAVE|nr:hypothetical protein AVEN_190632-1 [Araneus ventricosus]